MLRLIRRVILVLSAMWLTASVAESGHNHAGHTPCQLCLCQADGRRKAQFADPAAELHAIASIAHESSAPVLWGFDSFDADAAQTCSLTVPSLVPTLVPVSQMKPSAPATGPPRPVAPRAPPSA